MMRHHHINLLGLAISTIASPLAPKSGGHAFTAYSFRDVPPTSEIRYIPCFDTFECTNLEVPLDYDDPHAGTTNIAFLRHKATKQPAKGDIIFNPGGPGAPGTEVVKTGYRFLRTLLGEQYNIVGMDPRGVKNSGPRLDCFGEQPWVDNYLATQLNAVDPRDNASLSAYYELAGAFGTWCTDNLDKNARYVNTPATARDMLQYAEMLAVSQKKRPQSALVNFYGASYGSVLGMTFATLYPERVGKFLLDSVADGVDYYWGNWTEGLRQADAAVRMFFTFCAAAGPRCALNYEGATPEDIERRVDDILAAVGVNPVPITDPYVVQVPAVITHIDVRHLIRSGTTNMPKKWPYLAAALVELENRKLSFSLGKGFVPVKTEDHSAKEELYLDNVPNAVIVCNDHFGSFNGSEKALVELFEEQRRRSKYLGDVWVTALPSCRNLMLLPPESQRFSGFRNIETKTPILFAQNAADPLTSSPQKMALFFRDSRVFQQNTVGHTLAVASSNCTSVILQQYFHTGRLPPKGTVCGTNFDPFGKISFEDDANVATRI